MAMTTIQRFLELEQRTERFAANIRVFLSKFPRTFLNTNDNDQLLRSSGSIGANYCEANETLGKKDFLMHIRISRKEAKESAFWLSVLQMPQDEDLQKERISLRQEARELEKIFGAIVRNTLQKK